LRIKNGKSDTQVGFISLGCSKNLVNTEQMMYLVKNAGYEVTGATEDVDVVVVNTCGFVGSAKDEATEVLLELIELKNQGSIGKIIAAGCLTERYKKDILDEFPEIDAIVGTGSFDDIVEVLEFNNTSYFKDINAPVSEANRVITTSPVWSYLKIADGCDNKCAYCCIPSLRGKYRSRPMQKILAEARDLTEKGTRELILVAQDLTRYGVDFNEKEGLKKLLISLEEIEHLEWIRLMYLYPDALNDEIIDFIAKSDKIVKYLDIPIQHINDNILKRMHRRGTGNEIRSLIKKLRERIDGVVIRTSLITGLPGEGEKEFDELCQFLLDAKIERAGVFPYSPEEGTEAALMEKPDLETAVKRAETVQNIQSEIMRDFNRRRIGTTTRVLAEPLGKLSRSYAEAPEIDGYIKIKSKKAVNNSFLTVRITNNDDAGNLIGVPI